MESDEYYLFSISIIKSPKKFTTIQSSHYNNGRKYDCDKRSPKLFVLILIGLKMLMRT